MTDLKINIFQGDVVNFVDISTGDITEYAWTFPGGNPTGSTASNPTVTYNNIGKFDVSLTTKDIYGVYNTESKSGIINVEIAPWEVDFEFNKPVPVYMGDSIYLNNINIGEPLYSEWEFPSDGILSTGITLSPPNAKDSIGPLRYMNWNILTGSHISPPGTIYKGNVILFSSNSFAIGSKSKYMEIIKLGPIEEIYESYNYIPVPYSSDFNQAGLIYATPYGTLENSIGNENLTTGIQYSFPTRGISIGGYKEPYQLSDGSGLYKIDFNPNYSSTYWAGSTGPDGLYYPHVDTEKAYIRGRAFSPFNIEYNGKYKSTEEDIYNVVGVGKIIGDNIKYGAYTSDIKVPAPGVNEIVNPNFALIKDTYLDVTLNPFQRSYLSLYTRKSKVIGKDIIEDVLIHKTTIDNLLKHPISLPNPGATGYVNIPPTIGLVTSSDIHLSSDSRLNKDKWAMLYPNTAELIGEKTNVSITLSEIGKYPCIPSQFILPDSPSLDFISIVGPTGSTYPEASIIPPLGIDIEVKYENGDIIKIPVYFGLPDERGRIEGPIRVAESIDPLGTFSPGPTGCAQAYGNDKEKGSWILVEDTEYGIGIVTYINAYISDSNIGLPGGLSELMANSDPYWTLPTPYSDNSPGTITNGGTGTNKTGISLEIKNPLISSVTIKESYGGLRLGVESEEPFYTLASSNLINIPITWDFGRFSYNGTPAYPPFIDIDKWGESKYSYLGISSHMKPFSYGALSGKHSSAGKIAGIKIGGSI